MPRARWGVPSGDCSAVEDDEVVDDALGLARVMGDEQYPAAVVSEAANRGPAQPVAPGLDVVRWLVQHDHAPRDEGSHSEGGQVRIATGNLPRGGVGPPAELEHVDEHLRACGDVAAVPSADASNELARGAWSWPRDRNVGAAGLNPGGVRAVVLTHQHIDHTGTVPAFEAAEVWTTAAEDHATTVIRAGRCRWRSTGAPARHIGDHGEPGDLGPEVDRTPRRPPPASTPTYGSSRTRFTRPVRRHLECVDRPASWHLRDLGLATARLEDQDFAVGAGG